MIKHEIEQAEAELNLLKRKLNAQSDQQIPRLENRLKQVETNLADL